MRPPERPRDCAGCKWYYDWIGVCGNGLSKQWGDVSERCELYDRDHSEDEHEEHELDDVDEGNFVS